MPRFEIASFYKFTPLPDPDALRGRLKHGCQLNGKKGTVLLATEGVNGTIAGEPEALANAMAGIREMTGLSDLPVKTSYADTMPFIRLKVRVRNEIVTIGDSTVNPGAQTGTLVEPSEWNTLISDPDVLLIDVRNAFEVAAGSFQGAMDPKTRSFSDFPDFVRDRLTPFRRHRVAMFCTGGIRCEKASSLLLREGFTDVAQLKGGILAYLEQIPSAESLWRGGCFVFDGRIGVAHGLAPADLTSCFGCRHPLSAADHESPAFEEGVSCPHCAEELSETRKASARERHRQVRLADRRGLSHLGTDAQPANAPPRPDENPIWKRLVRM